MLQVLAFCYFLAFLAALLKAARYYVDYRRSGRGYYLIGVPANLALALALALIVVANGQSPLWQGEAVIVAIRLSFIAWAVLSMLFEVLYVRTYLVVTPSEPEEDEEVTT